jgi:hypothetical protein
MVYTGAVRLNPFKPLSLKKDLPIQPSHIDVRLLNGCEDVLFIRKVREINIWKALLQVRDTIREIYRISSK